jgi:hypothetical protein
MSGSVTSTFREVTAERADEYVAGGHKRRRFFPHRTYHLPKCGPDGLELAERMRGSADPATMWELVLYADPALLEDLPPDLFFDDDVMWHRQQFGRPGQVASASVVLDGDAVFSITHVSDLVQRISHRRELKTWIEKRFDGWRHMLLNAVLGFALEHGARRVVTPTSTLAHRHTDRGRVVGIGLFEHVYDRAVTDLFSASRDGEWWVIDVGEERDRLVIPEHRVEARRPAKAICVCHELTRGHGHETRRIEAELGVRATYFAAGPLMAEVKEDLEAEGHCVAFGSPDARLDRKQLQRSREVDNRVKGYRPPESGITRDDERLLLFYNFEWVAGSARSLGVGAPEMRSGLVRFPIVIEAGSLGEDRGRYERWEQAALAAIEGAEFAAIRLPDGHAADRPSRYTGFLERVQRMGTPRTLDDVAAEVTLCSAQ